MFGENLKLLFGFKAVTTRVRGDRPFLQKRHSVVFGPRLSSGEKRHCVVFAPRHASALP
jgi:hypothetical protein